MNALNIGNTHCTCGVWENGSFRSVRTIPTQELTADFLPEGETFAASVVPECTRLLAGERVVFIDALSCVPGLDFSGVDAAKLGADRVANAFALLHFFAAPAVVFDFGTAITYERIDENGRFYSGAIAPGRKLMRRALSSGTALLPEIPLTGRAPSDPGNDTISNLSFGIDRGVIGMTREFIRLLRATAPVEKIVFGGGDAAFFLPEFPEALPVPENFTLHGILLAAGVR